MVITAPVKFVSLDPRPTAVVAQPPTCAAYPRLWGRLLDEIYGFVRARTELETEIYWLLR